MTVEVWPRGSEYPQVIFVETLKASDMISFQGHFFIVNTVSLPLFIKTLTWLVVFLSLLPVWELAFFAVSIHLFLLWKVKLLNNIRIKSQFRGPIICHEHQTGLDSKQKSMLLIFFHPLHPSQYVILFHYYKFLSYIFQILSMKLNFMSNFHIKHFLK